jgi:hypothetical protein
LILFPLSICFIFYNERSAVKDTQFTDILDNSNVKEYNSVTLGGEAINGNQVHVYNGTVNVLDNARVSGLDLEPHVFRQNHILHPSSSNPPPSQDLNQTQQGDNNQSQLGYSQTINGSDEKEKLNPPVAQSQQSPTPIGIAETKILSYDFFVQDFVNKIEEQDGDGGITIKNVWKDSENTPLFKENDGLYTAIYNFDNKVRIQDQNLLSTLYSSIGQNLSFNDELLEQFKNFFQVYELYKSYNL